MLLTIASVVLFLLDYFWVGFMLGLGTSPLPLTAVIMIVSPLVTVAALLQAARTRSRARLFINGTVLVGYAYLALYLFLPWPDSDLVRRELQAMQRSVTQPLYGGGACGGRTYQIDYFAIRSDAGAAAVRAQFEERLRTNGWTLEVAPKAGPRLVTCASKGKLVAVLWEGSPHRDTMGHPDCKGVLGDGGESGEYMLELGVGRFRSCAVVRP
jgi:hypothetical protein